MVDMIGSCTCLEAQSESCITQNLWYCLRFGNGLYCQEHWSCFLTNVLRAVVLWRGGCKPGEQEYFKTPKWQIFCIVTFATSNTSVCYVVRPVKYRQFLFECHIKLPNGLTCLLVGLIALIWFSWTARFHDYPGPRNSIDVTTCSIYNWNISSLTAPEKKWVKDCFLYLLNDI